MLVDGARKAAACRHLVLRQIASETLFAHPLRQHLRERSNVHNACFYILCGHQSSLQRFSRRPKRSQLLQPSIGVYYLSPRRSGALEQSIEIRLGILRLVVQQFHEPQ